MNWPEVSRREQQRQIASIARDTKGDSRRRCVRRAAIPETRAIGLTDLPAATNRRKAEASEDLWLRRDWKTPEGD